MCLIFSQVPSEITDSFAERLVIWWSKFETSNLSVWDIFGMKVGSIYFANSFGMSNEENQGCASISSAIAVDPNQCFGFLTKS